MIIVLLKAYELAAVRGARVRVCVFLSERPRLHVISLVFLSVLRSIRFLHQHTAFSRTDNFIDTSFFRLSCALNERVEWRRRTDDQKKRMMEAKNFQSDLMHPTQRNARMRRQRKQLAADGNCAVHIIYIYTCSLNSLVPHTGTGAIGRVCTRVQHPFQRLLAHEMRIYNMYASKHLSYSHGFSVASAEFSCQRHVNVKMRARRVCVRCESVVRKYLSLT